MAYRENPKTKGSGILCCIPQAGRCPNNCEDCFFQSGRSYLEPLDENLPNMPYGAWRGQVVRVNDGNDSNVNRRGVLQATALWPDRFYNTAMANNLDEFSAPVVLTINPGKATDEPPLLLSEPPENLMFVRYRANTWNMPMWAGPMIEHYAAREVPVVLTWMAYCDTADKIPEAHRHNYAFRQRTLNSYWAITSDAWAAAMEPHRFNKWVHSCGHSEGERGTTACRHCGNCLREYFATMERLRLRREDAR